MLFKDQMTFISIQLLSSKNEGLKLGLHLSFVDLKEELLWL